MQSKVELARIFADNIQQNFERPILSKKTRDALHSTQQNLATSLDNEYQKAVQEIANAPDAVPNETFQAKLTRLQPKLNDFVGKITQAQLDIGTLETQLNTMMGTDYKRFLANSNVNQNQILH